MTQNDSWSVELDCLSMTRFQKSIRHCSIMYETGNEEHPLVLVLWNTKNVIKLIILIGRYCGDNPVLNLVYDSLNFSSRYIIRQ